MSCFWSKNIPLFKRRFPELAKLFNLSADEEPDFDFWEAMPSKSGELTAKENGRFIHSAYNPVREAKEAVKSARTEGTDCAVFFSMGLGYAPLCWAENFFDDTVIIIEKVPDYFFAAMKYNDFEPLFRHRKLIILLEASAEDVTAVIEHECGFKHLAVIESKPQSAHAQEYFNSLRLLFERNRQKDKINSATLEKFSSLWLRNSCRNLHALAELDGVEIYKDSCPSSLPALLIGAGPTLHDVLPLLKELKKRCLVVAVDTALRACLQAGTEPDFIVLTDPQYYAWRHIAGLKSPSSVLIAESAVYPPAFRFECRKKVLCSSLFPLGQYFEKKMGTKGKLGTGGSVATTAWDFCVYAGAKTIYCAGLDLGYPELESHTRGSLFEENAHRRSGRLHTAENSLAPSLFAANRTEAKDYSGGKLLTDSKMRMFAWWFESQAQKNAGVKSCSLSKKSYAIPGFGCKDAGEIIAQEEKTELRKKFFECESAAGDGRKAREETFSEAMGLLRQGLSELYELARKGFYTADRILREAPADKAKTHKATRALEEIDSAISCSQFKQVASLVFPAESSLEKIFSQMSMPADKTAAMFMRSKAIYRNLMDSIAKYKKYLK